MTANATLARPIGRNGRASLTYDRGAQMVIGLETPVFADSVTADVSRSFGQRVSASGNFRYYWGGVGAGAEGNHYKTMTGSGRVTVAITRRTQAYAEYAYTENDLGTDVSLPSGAPGKARRQSARAGLSLRVPVIQRIAR